MIQAGCIFGVLENGCVHTIITSAITTPEFLVFLLKHQPAFLIVLFHIRCPVLAVTIHLQSGIYDEFSIYYTCFLKPLLNLAFLSYLLCVKWNQLPYFPPPAAPFSAILRRHLRSVVRGRLQRATLGRGGGGGSPRSPDVSRQVRWHFQPTSTLAFSAN